MRVRAESGNGRWWLRMADVLQWISTALERLAGEQLVRRRRVVHPLPDGWCVVDGRRLRNFASNDYLGLAGDERLLAAARSAMESAGAGARSSPLVCGRSEWHERLETRLAEFEGAEAAILFPTGYAANAGTIAALVGRGDVVIGDRLNHASLIDGCRMSRADVRIYPHRDVAALESELDQHAGARRKLIVTDGVFSMDGDLAPLRDLVEVPSDILRCCWSTKPTAPASGGRADAACEELHVENRVHPDRHAQQGGGHKGFAVGSRSLVDWLWHSARPQVFSTAAQRPAVRRHWRRSRSSNGSRTGGPD
ncbi:MAG: aminotransferase class I/II-fold pyridoxal phosphate-dependent enzyme [Planctomycetaceae bacterium]